MQFNHFVTKYLNWLFIIDNIWVCKLKVLKFAVLHSKDWSSHPSDGQPLALYTIFTHSHFHWPKAFNPTRTHNNPNHCLMFGTLWRKRQGSRSRGRGLNQWQSWTNREIKIRKWQIDKKRNIESWVFSIGC